MKFNKNVFLSLIISILLLINITSCTTHTSKIGNLSTRPGTVTVVQDVSPQEIFLKAWQTVNDEYLDKTYNHQDWGRWKTRYLDKIKTRQDAYVAIQTMLESLNDPYTRFLTPSDFDEQNRNIEAKLYGIGVHIVNSKKGIIIISVINKTPAQAAGLKSGDIIAKVNQTSTKGMDIKQVADRVRGKAGTKVRLTISRNNKYLVKDVLRKKIDIKTVDSKILDKKWAYIHISSFISSETSEEMVKALNNTKNSKGIIIDLRGNYGGLLPNAVLISNLFLDHGAIVSIVDRDGYKETIDAESIDISSHKPVVVLINNSSASASEILSGALKDHRRAVLVGEKTFGKGLVQKIVNLPDGSGINITIAKYLTPNGTDINKKGIEPNYKVAYTEKDFLKNRDPQLNKAKAVLSGMVKAQEIAKTASR